ncbi:LRR domain containing protein [Parasponia andersonii]|uniref:LRR domain containing protein n=1 Tax=Parasponia andersonii TaxID=3476 RepID=A0A2P5B023_PARAD|nr:LRR domain containing protein [Parasponia andersonii]
MNRTIRKTFFLLPDYKSTTMGISSLVTMNELGISLVEPKLQSLLRDHTLATMPSDTSPAAGPHKLEDEIPREITEVVGLVSLNLSRHKLSGELPSDIGDLKSLDSLDLSNNHFSGEIPSSVSEVDRLSLLDLSNNNLSGKIPKLGKREKKEKMPDLPPPLAAVLPLASV